MQWCRSRLDEMISAAKPSDSSEQVPRSPRRFQSSVDGMLGYSGSADCDGDSEFTDHSEDERLTGDSTATRGSEAEQRSSPATTDNLVSRISKQIDDALEPLLSILRGVEEDEHKHREKLLAIEKRKLALENEKIQFFTRHGALSWDSLISQPQVRLVDFMGNTTSAPEQPMKDGAEEKGVSAKPSSTSDGSLQPPKLSNTVKKERTPDDENLPIAKKFRVVACSDDTSSLFDDSNAGETSDKLKDHISSEGDHSQSVALPKLVSVERRGDLEHFRKEGVTEDECVKLMEDETSDGTKEYLKLFDQILPIPVTRPCSVTPSEVVTQLDTIMSERRQVHGMVTGSEVVMPDGTAHDTDLTMMTSSEPVKPKRGACGKELDPPFAKRYWTSNWTDDEKHEGRPKATSVFRPIGGYHGVRMDRRRKSSFTAEMRLKGQHRKLWLGCYKTQEAAMCAVDVARHYYHGSNHLNFPDSPQCLPPLPLGLTSEEKEKFVKVEARRFGLGTEKLQHPSPLLSALPESLLEENSNSNLLRQPSSFQPVHLESLAKEYFLEENKDFSEGFLEENSTDFYSLEQVSCGCHWSCKCGM